MSALAEAFAALARAIQMDKALIGQTRFEHIGIYGPDGVLLSAMLIGGRILHTAPQDTPGYFTIVATSGSYQTGRFPEGSYIGWLPEGSYIGWLGPRFELVDA